MFLFSVQFQVVAMSIVVVLSVQDTERPKSESTAFILASLYPVSSSSGCEILQSALQLLPLSRTEKKAA